MWQTSPGLLLPSMGTCHCLQLHPGTLALFLTCSLQTLLLSLPTSCSLTHRHKDKLLTLTKDDRDWTGLAKIDTGEQRMGLCHTRKYNLLDWIHHLLPATCDMHPATYHSTVTGVPQWLKSTCWFGFRTFRAKIHGQFFLSSISFTKFRIKCQGMQGVPYKLTGCTTWVGSL